MKVKIKDIVIPWYAPRDVTESEFIGDLMRSLESSGQWNPILLRLNDSKEYELIAGLQRMTAAKKLGWEEIEANVLNNSEEEAALLAIETNLMRKELKEIEEGRAIKEMMDKLDLNQVTIAKKLGKSQMWVSNRLSLALDLVEPVREMIKNNFLNPSQAITISRLRPNEQTKFAQLIIDRQKELGKKMSADEIRTEIKKFRNNTIYTVGYEGESIEEFISKLKKSNIEVLLDIRESTKSIQKPDFSEKFLKISLKDENIRYLTRKDLGAPYVIRNSYINGGLSQKCFDKWYRWHVTESEGNKLPELLGIIKNQGKTALMCFEKDVKTCHRNILADLIMETNIFDKRSDL